MDGRLYQVASLIHLHFGELHNQDGVLRRQSHQHDQPYLEIDIVLQSTDRHSQVSAQCRHRQREQHGDGHRPTLILRRKEKEHEQEHQRQHKPRLPSGFLLLIRESTPLQTDVVRQVTLGNLFHLLHRLPGAVALCGRAADDSRGKHIEAFDAARSGGVGSVSQSGQRNHRPVLRLHEEEVDVVLVLPIRGFRLDIHFVDAVEHVEIVHIHRTRISLHGREHIRKGHSQHLHLIAVHVKIELRNLRLQGGGKPRQLLLPPGIVHQRVRRLHQVVEGGIATRLQLHLETARTAQSRNDRRRGEIDLAFGVFLELLLHPLHNLIQGNPLAFLPRFQDNRQLTACLAAAHTGAAARHVLYIGDIRILLQVLHGTLRHCPGPLQGRPFRQLQFHLEIALVFCRQEAGGYQPVDDENGNQHNPERTHQTARISDDAVDDGDILVIPYIQPRIDFAEHDVFLLSAVRLQDERAQHGTERQSHHRGEQYGDGDGDGELPV